MYVLKHLLQTFCTISYQSFNFPLHSLKVSKHNLTQMHNVVEFFFMLFPSHVIILIWKCRNLFVLSPVPIYWIYSIWNLCCWILNWYINQCFDIPIKLRGHVFLFKTYQLAKAIEGHSQCDKFSNQRFLGI